MSRRLSILGLLGVVITFTAGRPVRGETSASAPATAASGAKSSLPVYHLQRLEQFDDPRVAWVVLAIFAVVAVGFVAWQYRRESDNLPRLAPWGLGALRLLALIGAAIFYLGPIQRTDREVVTPSRVAVLVDTSQSMAVQDERDVETKISAQDDAAAESVKVAAVATAAETASRSEAATAAVSTATFLSELRQRHDIALLSFDAETRRLAQWKLGDAEVVQPKYDWTKELAPVGTDTRLGDALAQLIADQSGGPLAGVIVLSDGGNTAGLDPLSLVEKATASQTQIVAIGLGSTQPRRNVRLQDLVAPPRAYPKDKVKIRAIVQGEEFRGRSVDVELFLRESAANPSSNAVAAGAAVRVGRATAQFDEDRQSVAVEFEIEPAAAGRLGVEARLVAPPEDQYADDNQRSAEIEVVDSSTRVLLLASGATRDYRFLRDQLRRDPHVAVDVLLQRAGPGISQDSDKILTVFPTTKEELFAYDCLVAFDPDWTQLDAQQVDLLEEWVAQEAGGMIVEAGPIHAAPWLQSPEHAKIRSLYPVEFQQRLTLLDDGKFGSQSPWPLEFTREGIEADFLWLGDDAQRSRANWARFGGVYGCYITKGAKPGAAIYARFSDPDIGISVERPIYMADQFYGAGRVFFLGSGELWRLRAVDPGFFESLLTQLVRHVSQGRLLRGSSLGRLLVERDRFFVGDAVVVRAQVNAANREPYVAPQVVVRTTGPRGWSKEVVLKADETRAGNYLGQFTVPTEGAYRLDLSIPDVPEEILSRQITVNVPDVEFADTRRNETLLSALANRTGGHYYASVREALDGSGDVPPAARWIANRSETRIERGQPSEAFTLSVNRGLLGIICGALCLEWLLRRLLRLA